MNTVLKIFLSMSFSGSLLILILLWGKRFWEDKISRQWQYYIWLVVVLRLLIPFGPETNLMGKTYEAADRMITQAVSAPLQQSILHGPEDIPVPAVHLEQNNENVMDPTEDLATAHPLQDIRTLLINHVWLIWLVLALGLLIRKITIYQSFLQYIRAGRTPVSDMEILDRLSVTAKQAGIQRPIELCVHPLVSSPLLIGFFHPCIVLPSTDLPEKDFPYIILHELTHYRRRDLLYKWLVQVTVCLHWFNPLVYFMNREITRACEFSCDEAVLAKTGGGNAQAYGKTLLNAMAAVGKYRENFGAVTLSENKQLLKERLNAIMKFKKLSRFVKVLTIILTLCMIFGASFLGTYTIGNASAVPGSISPDTTGRPSLSLDISSAAVNVLAAADNKISAEYNHDIYMVDIQEQDNEWNVSISCKTQTNTNDETIQLYIPDVDYGDVNLSADSGHLICGLIKTGNIVGSFHMASVFLTLQEGFEGSVDVTANSGYFQLISQDNFKNTTVTITDNGHGGEIYRPRNFEENGNISTFTDGTGKNVIQVTKKGFGMMGIYGSDIFDTWNIPKEWKYLWQNQGQETSWEDDERQNNFSLEIEQYYEAGSLPLFEIAFAQLDEEAQEKWLDKIYADGQTAFWGAAIGVLDEDCAFIRRYAQKVYEEDNIAYFSILATRMSEDTLEIWLDRAQKDEKWNFQSVLFSGLGREDEFDKLEEKQEKEWEKEQAAEYQAAGVTMDGKNYYYQGQLVRLFLDIRSNKSFYTLDMNPKGTINIKMIRSEENEITGVAYMTEAEVTELLGDME